MPTPQPQQPPQSKPQPQQDSPGRRVFFLLGQVIRPHIETLSREERGVFWRLLADTAAKYIAQPPRPSPQDAPETATAPAPTARAEKKVTTPARGTSPDAMAEKIEQASDLVEQIRDMAEEVSGQGPNGDEFATSVLEKADDIWATVEERNHVTDKQLEALENMAAGLSRWLR